ncbi:telomere-protecting terminal protein Tpg [Streptomyces sp. NPDC056948]|uniref:telomere-protecting terminal protein Tpg n=1 Tax=Streptomyces sp. NPDC056948 TaxID=3345975 RepID=UPI00362C722D
MVRQPRQIGGNCLAPYHHNPPRQRRDRPVDLHPAIVPALASSTVQTGHPCDESLLELSLRLSADTVQEALDRADSRHWTRNPPRSTRARLTYLLKQTRQDAAALADLLQMTSAELNVLRASPQIPADHPLHQTVEREVVRLWQPRVRRRAHATILANNGQMMLSFRAWLGFTAAAGSSDDPRLRFLTLSLQSPHPHALFTARHRDAPEPELRGILNDALGACYFHRNRPTPSGETVSLERIDFLEFHY